MNSSLKILYPIIDGQVTGGNIVCLYLIEKILNLGGEVIVNSPSDGPFCDILRAKGVNIYYFNTSRSYHWNVALKISKIIKRQNISLIHSHTPFAGSMLTCIAGKIAGIPVINHAHVSDSLSHNLIIRNYQKLMNWWMSRNYCNVIISVSEMVKKEAIAQGSDSSKFQVIYNGTPLNALESFNIKGVREDIRRQLNIYKDIPIAIHVGRLCETKGQHLLIKAASHLRQSGIEIIYLIVGEDLVEDGEYRQYLKALATELEVDDLVLFLGQRSDIPQLLATADFLVLPSTAEGLPLVILEAMAAGRPVIATKIGGVPEIVEHQKTGLLVPIENITDLAEAILWMVQHPESAHKMGLEGLEVVRKDFSVEKMQQEILSIYDRLLAQKV